MSFLWPSVAARAVIVIDAAWAITSGVAEIAFALSSPDTLAYP